MTAMQSAIGDYRFVARIDEGGMGAVYRAVHQTLGNEVAIKLLPSALAHDETARQWFQRGAASAAALQHPNILPVYYYGEHDGAPYLVMPYVKGGTLKDRMLAGPLSQSQVVGYLRQLAAALDYAHEQGIVHRDVKPANLLLDERGHLYLADFGIARALESATRFTRTGTAVGTPEYMAPEQTRGQTDHRSDLYAVGIILYQLLTGQVPFTGDSAVEILLKHLQEPLPLAPLRSRQPAVPPALERVLQKALAKDPNARYQRAAALVADVEAVLAGGPLGADRAPVDFDATMVARSAPSGSFAPGTRTQLPLTPPPLPPQTLVSATPMPPGPTPVPIAPTPMPYAVAPTPQPPPSMTPAPAAPPPTWQGNAPANNGSQRDRRHNPLVIWLSIALVATVLLSTTYIAWDQFRSADDTTSVTNTLSLPSPSVAAQASPSPLASPSPQASPSPSPSPSASPSPSPSAKPSPSPSAKPSPSPVSRQPSGTAPDGWLTYSGTATTPLAVYYPPNWTVDKSEEQQGKITFWAPGRTAKIRFGTLGQAEPGSNFDQLRGDLFNAEVNYCIKHACSLSSVQNTGYDSLDPLFAWFYIIRTNEDGTIDDLRDGIALKGDVMWVYNVVASRNDRNNTADVMNLMLPSLNIYANP